MLRTSTGNLIKKNQGTDELKWMFWFSSGLSAFFLARRMQPKMWNLLIFFAVMFDVSYSTPELANQNAPRGFYPRPGPLPGPVHIYRKRNCHRYPCNDLVFLQCVSPGCVRHCVRQMVSSNVYFAARFVCHNVRFRRVYCPPTAAMPQV